MTPTINADSRTDPAFEALVKGVGRELEDFALGNGPLVATEVQKAARRVGVPAQYLFWTLVDQPGLWPPMDPRKKAALKMAVFLMEQSDATPNFAVGFELPDEVKEGAVEDVLEAAGTWSKGPLWASMMRKYMTILDAKKAEAGRVLGLSPDQARPRLEAGFLVAVERRPRWFRHPDLLAWIVRPFIG